METFPDPRHSLSETARPRALLIDPLFAVAEVGATLAPLGVEVATSSGRPEGTGVVALFTGSEYPVSAADLGNLPNLRVIGTSSVGIDHLPLGDAADRGIWVVNVPDFCTGEVADSTMALVLALLRGTVFLDRSTQRGEWDSTTAGTLQRVAGTRLGLIGFGRIGRAVAARARPFGLEVWVHDPALERVATERHGVIAVGLGELLAGCDVVSLHAPLDAQRGSLIGRDELSQMRRGTMLVNTSRGALVDVDALLRALDEGRVGGAALDVLPAEPPSPREPAPSHERLILTPHAAWYSEQAETEAYSIPIEAAVSVLSGRKPPEELVVVRGHAGTQTDRKTEEHRNAQSC